MSPDSGRAFALNHSMIRVRDPKASLAFYGDILDMTLLNRFDFPDMSFSLYFLGFVAPEESIPPPGATRNSWMTRRSGLLELTHNWGSESATEFSGYHNGNDAPRGFGHICVTVANVTAACERYAAANVKFVKRPSDGKLKGIAFIADPDGYWIEIIDSASFDAILPETTDRATSSIESFDMH